MDGVVIQVVVQDAGAHTVVFQLTFHHAFLKVAEEAEHLSVVLEPGRLDTGDVVILGLLAGLLEGDGGLGAEGFKQDGILIFSQEVGLLTHYIKKILVCWVMPNCWVLWCSVFSGLENWKPGRKGTVLGRLG